MNEITRDRGVRPFAFTYAAFSIARFQLFDSFRRFLSEGGRLTCDAYLAKPFDVWRAPSWKALLQFRRTPDVDQVSSTET